MSVTSANSIAVQNGDARSASGASASASGSARNSSIRLMPARAGSTSREYRLAQSSEVLTERHRPWNAASVPIEIAPRCASHVPAPITTTWSRSMPIIAA